MKMEKQDGKKFEKFKSLLEKHYLKKDARGITDGMIKEFRTDLDKLRLSKEDIFLNLVQYFTWIFYTATIKTTDKPLHTNRDYGLEIFAKVFLDIIAGLREPVLLGDYDIRIVDLIIFLSGITDGPFLHEPMSDELAIIAGSDETVLIIGETGTGKELHAKAIHYLSTRSKERFVAFNCAGIPDTLLESTLFGHVKGAFTGADRDRVGLLEEVGNGTLFLDEIGDMPMSSQPKLLRVLQSGEYEKLGSPKKMRFSGRVIAATNKDLRSAINEKLPTFRADLYYRLNVLPINLPAFRTLPLYERKSAILKKLRHVIYSKTNKPGDWSEMRFLSDNISLGDIPGPDGQGIPFAVSSSDTKNNPYISPEALEILSSYTFQGNYRELDNIIKRIFILWSGRKIEAHMLGDEVNKGAIRQEQKAADKETGISAVMLKEIIKHADRVKADIVRKRVEAVYRDGRNLKELLMAEGATVSGYQTFRKKIIDIIGKEDMNKIINTYKKKQTPKKISFRL